MVLLFTFALLILSGILADSVTTVTNCDPPVSNDTCIQGPCGQAMCELLCGLTTNYDSCRQRCDANFCDRIECRATQQCSQTCRGGRCGSLICDAKNCSQSCSSGQCSQVRCAQDAPSCQQSSSSGEMICEGKSCEQECPGGECNMTCSNKVKTCSQSTIGGFVIMDCDAEGTSCQQQCRGGECNMTCSNKVKTCSQTTTGGLATMHCDADVCVQDCLGGFCNMTCSPSTSDCRQTCTGGKCLIECKADKCKVECPGGDLQCCKVNLYHASDRQECFPPIESLVCCHFSSNNASFDLSK